MPQEYTLVSPSLSACPKSGAQETPAFRPADPGDTAALSSAEEVCLPLLVPSRTFKAVGSRPQVAWHLAMPSAAHNSTQCSAGVLPCALGAHESSSGFTSSS